MVIQRAGSLGDESIKAPDVRDVLGMHYLTLVRQEARCQASSGVHSSARLGRHRWVTKRASAWLNQMKRLVLRYER